MVTCKGGAAEARLDTLLLRLHLKSGFLYSFSTIACANEVNDACVNDVNDVCVNEVNDEVNSDLGSYRDRRPRGDEIKAPRGKIDLTSHSN
jgi:hypothetical protein